MSSRRSIDPDRDEAELRALLQLRMVPGLPDQRLNLLISRHNPKSIVERASRAELGDQACRALASRPMLERVEKALRMLNRLKVTAVTVRDDTYPAKLRCLGDLAPAVLFMRGRTELLDTRSLAVIGARNSTEYGDSVAELFANELAARDITIISGLARGIDGIAHRCALDAGGATIAVLGCGIDVSYPPRNARLQERIAEEGLLISEFAPGDPAYPSHFPQRNRLIAILASGVLVIEAGLKSGTRKTVDWALDYSVPVFAVPGPIGRYESQGTNEIIQDGGRLVTSVRDILEELQWPASTAQQVGDGAPPVTGDAASDRILGKLMLTASHVDDIARRCGLNVPETLGHLTRLELDGRVRQHPGKRFSRVPAH